MSENSLYKISLAKAMALCSHREFCLSDIRDKLQAWGVGDIDIEKIIYLLVKENFINEERYTRAFVRDKFNYNKWGKVKIEAHLRLKRISADAVKSSLNVIDNELYIKTIKNLISVHRRNIKAKSKYELKAKLLRYGLSKGFESSILYDILNDLEE